MAFSSVYFSLLLCILKTCSSASKQAGDDNRLIVFAFSGLRWDSMTRFHLPAFEKLRKEGVHVMRKTDVFQTETLPSFVTMMTGRYPDSHGILSNEMKDLNSGYSFDLSGTDTKWWSRVNPLWITNQNNGNQSALCYWPGHQIAFNNVKAKYRCSDPDFGDPFQELTSKGEIVSSVMPFNNRLNQVKTWLNMTWDRPSFIGVYFEEPLKSIMKYGFNSNKTKEAFTLVNNMTQEMITYLQTENIYDKTNFIVTGESGVTDIGANQDIFLEDYLEGTHLASRYHIVDNGPITTIHPLVDDDTALKLMNKWSNTSANMTVYNGSDLPEEFHFTDKYRSMPIIVEADEGFRINQFRAVSANKAMMGYNGKYESTHALFIARGPSFKEGYSFYELENADVYNMMCKALNIKGESNSGDEKLIENAMRKPKTWYVKIISNVTKSPTRFTVAIIVATIMLFTALYLIILSISRLSHKCRGKKARKFEVFTPNKAFRKSEENGKLLSGDESDLSDLAEDLHFQMHKETDKD